MRDLRHDVGQLQSCNTVASQEIEELRTEVERLHSASEDLGVNADIESGEESRPKKRRKSKGKKPIRPGNRNDEESGSESDEEAARVRYIHFIATLYFY